MFLHISVIIKLRLLTYNQYTCTEKKLYVCGLILRNDNLTGEDLNSKARRKYQQEQLREWSTEQKDERNQAEKNQKTADRLYELKMKELDQRAMELAKAEEDCRRAINIATKDYNNALVGNSLSTNSFCKNLT